MGKTKIEWCHFTFNPWWGCAKVSPACAHCYAERDAARFGTEWGEKAERRFFGDKHWSEPLKWDRAAAKAGERHRVFCASMADVFEDRRDLDDARERLWILITMTPHLDWLLLTKRPENILRLGGPGKKGARLFFEEGGKAPDNVWIGTTVEDQERAELRIPHLLRVPARIRFLSCEPLLGPIDLRKWTEPPNGICGPCDAGYPTSCTCPDNIHWVIAGGESGHGARPMHPDWVREIRTHCAWVKIPFFFKQWGEWAPIKPEPDAEFHGGFAYQSHKGGRASLQGHIEMRKVVKVGGGSEEALMELAGKKAAGRLLDGVVYDAVPS